MDSNRIALMGHIQNQVSQQRVAEGLGRLGSLVEREPSPVDGFLIMGAMNASFVTDGILYGIHIVLFAMCCYILVTYQRRVQWFLLAAVCTMFAISTADIGLSIKLSTTDLRVLALPPDALVDRMPPKAVLFVTNNLIADILLFHRCFVIWGRPRIILYIALICLTADSIWGYLGHAARAAAWKHTFQPLYLWTVFALNITVTAAAVGRIYWVYVVGITPAERKLKRIYRAIIAAFVESAAIYSACILIYLLWVKLDEPSAYWVVPLTMMTRLVAIMPTLMIVQLGMSHRCCHCRHHPHSAFDSKNHGDSVILDTVISFGRGRDDHEDLEGAGARMPSGFEGFEFPNLSRLPESSKERERERDRGHAETSASGSGEDVKSVDEKTEKVVP